MEEKKSFFNSLEPKSALIVGLVSGVLVLCTIGFLIMLVLSFTNKSAGNKTVNNPTVNTNNEVVNTPTTIAQKSDRPSVELFVMSYCPFGLQMEKAFLPAWDLLKDKADINIKFVDYIMHGKEEIDENNRQYCIGQESKEKLLAYLKCFVAEDNSAKCLSSIGLTDSKLKSCVNVIDKQFKITELYNDQSTWLSGRYPLYNVHTDLNNTYGVQGSPTLVINGQEVSVNRTPEAIKQAICAAFNNSPSECSTVLSNSGYSAGFGLTASDNAANIECGV